MMTQLSGCQGQAEKKIVNYITKKDNDMETGQRNVMILCNTLSGGGIQKVMQDIANYLAARPEKYKVTVTVLESPERGTELLDPRIRICGIFRSKASYKRYSPAWTWYQAKRALYCGLMTRKKYDIVLILKDGWYFKLGGHLKACRKIAWFHTASSEKGQEHWTRIFFKSDEEERRCCRTYDHIVCVSEFGKKQVEDTIGKIDNLTVRYNPIDVKAIRQKAETERIDTGAFPQPIFVMVNRLSPIKQTKRVLQCMEKLQARYDCSLWVVGSGEQQEELEAYVQDHHLKNIRFWGWQNNPYPFILAADWFVSASEYETFGLTVHEAGVLNIPSIAATLPVFEECVDREKVLLVENGIEGLFQGMKYAAEHKDFRRNIPEKSAEGLHEEMYISRLRAIEDLITE